MMGEIEPSIRRGLIQATLHLVNREYAALADDFITLGLLPPGSDRGAIIPALTAVFQARSVPTTALSSHCPRLSSSTTLSWAALSLCVRGVSAPA